MDEPRANMRCRRRDMARTIAHDARHVGKTARQVDEDVAAPRRAQHLIGVAHIRANQLHLTQIAKGAQVVRARRVALGDAQPCACLQQLFRRRAPDKTAATENGDDLAF